MRAGFACHVLCSGRRSLPEGGRSIGLRRISICCRRCSRRPGGGGRGEGQSRGGGAGARSGEGDLDDVSVLPLLADKVAAGEWPERTLFIQCHRGLTPKLFQNAAAIGQRYKMVVSPGTFNREDFLPSATQPVLVLYDLEMDRGEERNLANEQSRIVESLQRQYEDWFADVWRS